jgi:ABC-type sugar transport system ATPase subunit
MLGAAIAEEKALHLERPHASAHARVPLHRVADPPKTEQSEAALEVRGLGLDTPEGRALIQHLDFTVKRGEIFGLFGLLGSGTGEVLRSIFGVYPGTRRGEIRVHGKSVSPKSPGDAIAEGLGLMAQDRRDTVLHEHTIAENIALASLGQVSKRGVLDPLKVRKLAKDYVARLNIKTPSIDEVAGNLSGGNQQKVHVARWLASGSDILMLIDPTRGVDVGARAEISNLWRQLATEGYAIVMVSSEAEELVEICHRVAVIHGGRQVAEFSGVEVTEDNLFRSAAGL